MLHGWGAVSGLAPESRSWIDALPESIGTVEVKTQFLSLFETYLENALRFAKDWLEELLPTIESQHHTPTGIENDLAT